MSGHAEPVVKLPKGVSVTIAGKTYRGECPDRLIPSEHKLRSVTEVKKKTSSRSTSNGE